MSGRTLNYNSQSSILSHQQSKSIGRRKQVKVIFLASIGNIIVGSLFTLPSVFASDIAAYNSTLYGSYIHFNDYQMDSMGSLNALGAVIGTVMTSYTVTSWGRRISLAIGSFFGLLSWLGVALIPNVGGILAARFIGGLSTTYLSITGLTYLPEVGENDFRGMLYAINVIVLLLGQLSTVVIGYWCHYYTTSLILSTISIPFFFVIFYIPESPSFLLLKGNEEQAVLNLKRLRGPSADLDAEIQMYREMNDNNGNQQSSWRAIIQPNILKSIGVVITLMFALNFSGYVVFAVNTSRIIKLASPTLDEDLATIIIYVVQIVPVILSGFLIDRIGRKVMLLISETIICVCVLSLGLFIQFNLVDSPFDGADLDIDFTTGNSTLQNPVFRGGNTTNSPYSWVPLFILIIDFCAVQFGLEPVPFLLGSEYIPTYLRPQVGSLTMMAFSLFEFAALELYTPMINGLTAQGMFYLFSVIAALCLPFTFYFVKETKGTAVG